MPKPSVRMEVVRPVFQVPCGWPRGRRTGPAWAGTVPRPRTSQQGRYQWVYRDLSTNRPWPRPGHFLVPRAERIRSCNVGVPRHPDAGTAPRGSWWLRQRSNWRVATVAVGGGGAGMRPRRAGWRPGNGMGPASRSGVPAGSWPRLRPIRQSRDPATAAGTSCDASADAVRSAARSRTGGIHPGTNASRILRTATVLSVHGSDWARHVATPSRWSRMNHCRCA